MIGAMMTPKRYMPPMCSHAEGISWGCLGWILGLGFFAGGGSEGGEEEGDSEAEELDILRRTLRCLVGSLDLAGNRPCQ